MNTANPEISIITPVYNTDTRFIEELKECILGQTFSHFEWLLIDDGSNESETCSYIQQLEKVDDRFRCIIHSSNKGLPAARNTGTRAATGKLLFFIDADDLIEPTTLEKLLLTLRANPHFEFVNSYVKGFGDKDYLWSGGFHDGPVFLRENRNTSCFMGRAEIIRCLLFNESIRDGGEDWDFWLHAASKGYWGYTVPEFLFKYRIVGKSKWRNIDKGRRLKAFARHLRTRYEPVIGEKFPERTFTAYTFAPAPAPVIPMRHGYKLPGNNILFILPWLEVGGADKFNLDLLKGLVEKGWKPTIACMEKSTNEWFKDFYEITKDIFILPAYSPASLYYLNLATLIVSRNINIVFLSGTTYGYYLLPWLRYCFPGIAVVDYLHNEILTWNNGGYPMFSIMYNNLLTHSFVSSHHLKKWCVERGMDADKTSVTYINVDEISVNKKSELRKAIRSNLGIDSDTPVILYVARLTPQKQPDVLMGTINRLFDKKINFHCIIIGDGPEKNALRRDIRRSPVKANIHYLGMRSNDEVIAYMSAADIFFLPSAFEGIAMSFYEAMACELVVVGADTGGQSELVTSDCGFLLKRSIAAEEANRYADILGELIEAPGKRVAMAKAGRARIEKHFRLRYMQEEMHRQLEKFSGIGEIVPVIIPDNYISLLNRFVYTEELYKQLSQGRHNIVQRLANKYPGFYELAKKAYKKFSNQ